MGKIEKLTKHQKLSKKLKDYDYKNGFSRFYDSKTKNSYAYEFIVNPSKELKMHKSNRKNLAEIYKLRERLREALIFKLRKKKQEKINKITNAVLFPSLVIIYFFFALLAKSINKLLPGKIISLIDKFFLLNLKLIEWNWYIFISIIGLIISTVLVLLSPPERWVEGSFILTFLLVVPWFGFFAFPTFLFIYIGLAALLILLLFGNTIGLVLTITLLFLNPESLLNIIDFFKNDMLSTPMIIFYLFAFPVGAIISGIDQKNGKKGSGYLYRSYGYVKEYYRRDGTRVRSHEKSVWRRK